MMEKFAQAGEGRGAPPPPLIIFTITYKVAVYDPTGRADTQTPWQNYQLLHLGTLPTDTGVSVSPVMGEEGGGRVLEFDSQKICI